MAALFDIQVNGFAGVDFQQPETSLNDLRKVVRALAEHETSRFLPTFITDRIDLIERKLRSFEQARKADPEIAAAIPGYHLEGPWLSPKPGFCGAHDPSLMEPPDLRVLERLQRAAGGRILLITLAPEWPGSVDFIRESVHSGVRISLGHTDASEKDIDLAIEAGARFCTHLGNAVPQKLHRHDNVIQRLLARDELTAFFIPDGIHIPPATLKNFVRAKPSDRVFFTTDCMSAAGAKEGLYRLGNLELEVGADRIVRFPGGRNCAGSALCADEGVDNIREWLGWESDRAERTFGTDILEAFGLSQE